jgi:uncharacterized protein YkwD
LRRVALWLAAIPVLVAVYLEYGLRRPLARAGAVAGLAVVFGVAGFGVLRPQQTAATPPSHPVALTDAALASRVTAGESPSEAVSISFPKPMNPRSVQAMLEVDPATDVVLSWDTSDTILTVRPARAWATGTYHTITVQAGALDASGRPTSSPIRASFLTRSATTAKISATDVVGGRAALDTRLSISFDHAVDPSTIALTIKPALDGYLEQTGGRGTPVGYVFVPSNPLPQDTRYDISLAGTVVDSDGAPVTPAALSIRTSAGPDVVRFRPAAGSTDVARDSGLSVRFTVAMDEASTKAAWSATADGKALAGSVTFSEADHVLVFQPAAALDYGATVAMSVGATAKSKAGIALDSAATASFTVVKQTTTAVRKVSTVTTVTTTTKVTSGTTAGSSVGSGTWYAVEVYYLGLLNCTHTGGWVSSTGSCSGYGSNGHSALMLDAGISTKVSRPYAKMLAVDDLCSHFIGGTPGDRLRAAGYTSYRWAENLGCRTGDPYAAVLGSHLFFQAEKPCSSCHYANIMSTTYDRVGIGVWAYSGRVRLVCDFYHP